MTRFANYVLESRVEDATRILAHYFRMAGIDHEDMVAEMRDMVMAIVGASCALAEEEWQRIPSHQSESGK